VPKLRLVGLEVSAPAAAPVAESGILKVGFEAVEVMVTVPLAAPATVGAKATLKLALWPAAKVTGAAMPVRLNPTPLVIPT
jgi:hypothetical protein